MSIKSHVKKFLENASKSHWEYTEDYCCAGYAGKYYAENNKEYVLMMGTITTYGESGSVITKDDEATFTGPRALQNVRLCSMAPDLLKALVVALDKLNSISSVRPDPIISKIVEDGGMVIMKAIELDEFVSLNKEDECKMKYSE